MQNERWKHSMISITYTCIYLHFCIWCSFWILYQQRQCHPFQNLENKTIHGYIFEVTYMYICPSPHKNLQLNIYNGFGNTYGRWFKIPYISWAQTLRQMIQAIALTLICIHHQSSVQFPLIPSNINIVNMQAYFLLCEYENQFPHFRRNPLTRKGLHCVSICNIWYNVGDIRLYELIHLLYRGNITTGAESNLFMVRYFSSKILMH